MKREMMAACALMLLGACERSNNQTWEFASSTPPLRPIDAATQKKIDTLRKQQQERHVTTEPSLTPTASPTTEK